MGFIYYLTIFYYIFYLDIKQCGSPILNLKLDTHISLFPGFDKLDAFI